MKTENEIHIWGYVLPENGLGNHIHFQDYVYDINGIARTLCYRDYKDGMRVLVFEKDKDELHTQSIHST